ncbi:MAG: hypothetical protein K6G60_10635 [Lachnospiraceae bacterium]|nr:hypothetical protein [Lachnospiraceae bacterium]
MENVNFEVMDENQLINCDGGAVAGAVFGLVFGAGSAMLTQCIKVVACEAVGYDGIGSDFSWAAVGVGAVRGAVAGALSPI